MKSITCFIFCVSFFFIHSTFISAQDNIADSLRNVLKIEKDDTNKVNTLKFLADRLRRTGNYDTALVCTGRLAELSEKLSNKKGLAAALNIEGVIYRLQGNYPKALENDFRSLSLYQELNDKNGTAVSLGNIGLVYWNQGALAKALNYDFRALAIYQSLKDKRGIARNLGNIGIVYYQQFNLAQALEYDLKSLAIDEEIGDKIGIAANLGDIGNVYVGQNNYTKALEYDFKALALDREIGDKNGVGRNFGNIGAIYTMLNNYKLSKIYLDSGLEFSKGIGEKESVKNIYYGLSRLDTTSGDYKSGLEDYKKYIIYRDSLVNEANTKKTVQAEMNFEFEQKQAAEKAAQDKKDAIAEQERNKQKVIRNSFIAGFALMLALAFFIFRGYRQKQKANEIIIQQKEEVEKQKALVEQQKGLVEEKNKDILDSITYAKRLQDAILPPLSLIKQHLPESFVLYKPKDIVAGDFYWMERVTVPVIARHEAISSADERLPRSDDGTRSDVADELILIAAADCTGHGVPGALVSVVCSNALNRTVKEFKITEPGKILDKVRELVLETFEKSEDNVQDGMDISLCALTLPSPGREGATDATVEKSASRATTDTSLPMGREGVRVQWSGAYNSLLYIQKGEMKELAADKQPIGKTDKPIAFTRHNIKLQKGDSLYLFTDGYADQFGGEKGKKFKYAQLQQLIIDNGQLTMEEQKAVLEKKLQEWKGNLEQVDDVLVIGVRV